VSPPLAIVADGEDITSFVLIVKDPDIPKAIREDLGNDILYHWIMFNISPATQAIAEDESVGTLGENSAGGLGYTGPCPPAQYEPTEHRYQFRVFALDSMLDLAKGATAETVKEALEGHVIASAQLTGRYQSVAVE
jgi:Raf kinase inhibitor-like YbhB/YbcL family protein